MLQTQKTQHPPGRDFPGWDPTHQMLPTTMHGTRPLVTIRDTRHGAAGAACDGDRGVMTKLRDKAVNYLRGLAL